MTENEISKHIVECAIEVHRTLGGPGLLESVYEEALTWGTPTARATCSSPTARADCLQRERAGRPATSRYGRRTQGHHRSESRNNLQFYLRSSGTHLPANARLETGISHQLRRALCEGRHSSCCKRALNAKTPGRQDAKNPSGEDAGNHQGSLRPGVLASLR